MCFHAFFVLLVPLCISTQPIVTPSLCTCISVYCIMCLLENMSIGVNDNIYTSITKVSQNSLSLLSSWPYKQVED